ncbi:GNAT family N-acetyltransferase [Cellulomonas sp. NPDC055163]
MHTPFPDRAPSVLRDELRTRIAAWGHPHAAELRERLADELRHRSPAAGGGPGQRRARPDGTDPSSVLLTVLVYDGSDAVATASLQEHDGRNEVTRLYVVPERRRRGLARRVIAELDEFARAAGVAEIVMAVPGELHELRSLCERDGWVRVAPFGGHAGECFASPVDTSRVGASLARAGIA